MTALAFRYAASARSIPVPARPGELRLAIAAAHPGDVLELEAGDHPIERTLRIEKPLSLVGPGGTSSNAATISGAYRIPRSSWKDEGGGLWSAEIPPGTWGASRPTPAQLWTGTSSDTEYQSSLLRRATRARHPNLYDPTGMVVRSRPYIYWGSLICPMSNMSRTCRDGKACTAAGCDEAVCTSCNERNRFGLRWNRTDDALFEMLPAAVRKDGSGLQAVVYHGWTASRHYVSEIRLQGHALIFRNPSDRPIGFWSGLQSEGGQRYYLDNAESLLDSAGEFFIRTSTALVSTGGGTLLYRPLPAELAAGPGGFEAWLPVLNELVVVAGASDVNFKSLTIAYSDWACGGPNRTEPCDGQSANWQDTAAVRLFNSSRVMFDDVKLLHHGPQALWVDGGCNDTVFRNGTIADLGTGAVRVGSQGRWAGSPRPHQVIPVRQFELSGTVITSGGWIFPSGTAVLVQEAVSGAVIVHNTISEFSYTAISLGWSWNYSPQPMQGNHVVRKNLIYRLGYPRREVGDAMACIYTLGQLNGTVVSGNVCHDVMAYMSGGYCLSQDQGSSNVIFTENVCLRVTGSPHNTHYGINLTYSNNVFWGGYFDSWVSDPVVGGAILRTSPSPGCGGDRLKFIGNLIGQGNNASTHLFDGNFNASAAKEGLRVFQFRKNYYWSTAAGVTLRTDAVFGGESARVRGKVDGKWRGPDQLTWDKWREIDAGSNDAGSVVASSTEHPFADDNWDSSLNLTVKASVADKIGWTQIDTASAGV